MRRSLVLVSSALMVIVLALSSSPSHAQSNQNWVSVVGETDLTGNSAMPSGTPFVAGHAYNVTIQVNVPLTQTNSVFQVNLDPHMAPRGAQFWYVKTPQYAGYNATAFSAGTRSVTFKLTQGQVTLSTVFQIPLNLTLSTVGSLTLHLPKTSFPLITVNVVGGSITGQLTTTVQDQTIQAYLSAYQSKSTLISSGKVAPAYSSVVDGILNESQALYGLGLAQEATALLDTISPSSLPSPPSTTLSTITLLGLIAAVIVIIGMGVAMLRGRGRHGYSAGIVSEVQKELAVLEVTASKYDKLLADRLKALRDKLGETS